MGYVNLKPEQSNIFFKLMEERLSIASTIGRLPKKFGHSS